MSDLFVECSTDRRAAGGNSYDRPIVPRLLLTPQEAAEATGRSRKELDIILPRIRIGDRLVRYSVADVEALARGGMPALEAREWCRTVCGLGPFDSLVYFVQTEEEDGSPGPIKIGISARSNLTNRLSSMQTDNHRKLWFVAGLTGNGELERALHRRFDAHRIRGEWFHPHPDILSFLGAMALGSPRSAS